MKTNKNQLRPGCETEPLIGAGFYTRLELGLGLRLLTFKSLVNVHPNVPTTFRRITDAIGWKRVYLFSGFFFFFNPLFSQLVDVKGVVVAAESNEPLIGVNVVLKDTDIGASTDVAGAYKITVNQNLYGNALESGKLIFYCIGYKVQEVELRGRTRVSIAMEPIVTQLEEVVVTGSAVGRSPKLMSYSVGFLDEAALNAVPAANAGAGLQGKVPGLRVNPVSGQPGQGAYFQIRSADVIANGQQPLLVVDGIFLNGATLADFNAEDIERIEILKGSAGTSLYGSQAANGVVQVFTKRGKNLDLGTTRITYRGETGYSESVGRYNLNTFTNREILDPEGPQPILGNPSATGIHDTPLPNLQDYQEDVLFRRGAFRTHYLALQGKTAQSNFHTSVQRYNDEGILQNTDGYLRHTFRANMDHRISEKLELQVNSMYSTSRQDLLAPASNGPGSYLASALFLTPIFNLDVGNEENGSAFDWDIDNTGLGITNPLYDRLNSRQTVRRSRFTGSLGANYYAKEWLTLGYAATLDHTINDFEHFVEKGYLSANVPGLFGNLVTAGVQGSSGGGIHKSRQAGNYVTSRANITIQKQTGKLNAAVRGSFLYEDLTRQYDEAIGENLAVSGIHSLDNARSNIAIASEAEEMVGYTGFLIGDVDFKKTYIFSGLIRREGVSLFGPESRWANYHRLSTAWRVTETVKLKGIQELKLRASTGTSGIRPAFGQRFETFELINGTLTKSTLGNEFLKPARSTEIEIGGNITFLRAFDLEVNYSQIKTDDQILLVPLTGAAGFKGQWRNAGAIDATVYEAALNIDFKKLFRIAIPDFRWELMTTFDRTEQMISRLDIPAYVTGPGLQQSSLFLIEEGQPFGTMVGEIFARDLSELDEQEGVDPNDYTINPVGYVVRKDQIGTPDERPYKLRDANGNPIVRAIGDINPDFRMGFAHTLAYKGFQLYALFDWKRGGDVYNLTKQWLYRDDRSGDVSQYPDVTAGFYGSEGLYNVLVANNHFVEDGTFFMLREAAISFTIRQGLFGNFIKSMRLSLIGRNLFTVTDYSGLHPDVSAAPRDENLLTNRFQNAPGSDAQTPNGDPNLFAVDAFNYPLARTLTFGLQLTF